ncbi:hypothetical protein [Streptomyces alkaliterrae]|nr:hypothetical protein [Streptomyces alkaliterrae]
MAEESGSQRYVDDSEFMEFTQNDPVAARRMRLTLEKLAEGGAGDTVKEMAQEVLTGRMGLREAVANPTYAEGLISSMQPFKEKWDELSDDQRAELAAEGERMIAEQERELREERAQGQASSRRDGGPRHTGGWSLY